MSPHSGRTAGTFGNKQKIMIVKIKDMVPEIGKGTFIAETSAVIGDVRIGEDSSIWYSAVLRGDVNHIDIGSRVSIQDGAVVHTTTGEGLEAVIGDDVVVGHNATIHSARIDSHCLIGMGATILDKAHVGQGSIVAAGALVLSRTEIGPNELWGGVPAKFIKSITPEAVARTIDQGVAEYVEWAHIFNEERENIN